MASVGHARASNSRPRPVAKRRFMQHSFAVGKNWGGSNGVTEQGGQHAPLPGNVGSLSAGQSLPLPSARCKLWRSHALGAAQAGPAAPVLVTDPPQGTPSLVGAVGVAAA